jgi:hypothetical protein
MHLESILRALVYIAFVIQLVVPFFCIFTVPILDVCPFVLEWENESCYSNLLSELD